MDVVFQRVTLVDVKFQSEPTFRPSTLPRKLLNQRPQSAMSESTFAKPNNQPPVRANHVDFVEAMTNGVISGEEPATPVNDSPDVHQTLEEEVADHGGPIQIEIHQASA